MLFIKGLTIIDVTLITEEIIKFFFNILLLN